MKTTVETYEQGTGKLINTEEIEVPDPPMDKTKAKLDELENRIAGLETKIEALK